MQDRRTREPHEPAGGGYTGPFREFNGVNEEDIFHTAHQVYGGDTGGKISPVCIIFYIQYIVCTANLEEY